MVVRVVEIIFLSRDHPEETWSGALGRQPFRCLLTVAHS